MGDKDKPNIFNGKQRIFVASKDDVENWEELPIVEDSVQYSGYYDCPDLSKSNEPIRFSIKVDHPAELLLLKHPDVQKCLDRAQKMLDEIKSEVKAFYTTDPPRNRKERRARAKELKIKINRFNSYCKDRGIKKSSK